MAVQKRPIHEAISEVLRRAGRALAAREIYEEIEKRALYEFKAVDPLHVVSSVLRRHAKELDFPSARGVKYFSMTSDGRFALLRKPVVVGRSLFEIPNRGTSSRSSVVVTVPADEEQNDEGQGDGPSHSEIQWRLLDLGAQMGMAVWAPRGDRGKVWSGRTLGSVRAMLKQGRSKSGI